MHRIFRQLEQQKLESLEREKRLEQQRKEQMKQQRELIAMLKQSKS